MATFCWYDCMAWSFIEHNRSWCYSTICENMENAYNYLHCTLHITGFLFQVGDFICLFLTFSFRPFLQACLLMYISFPSDFHLLFFDSFAHSLDLYAKQPLVVSVHRWFSYVSIFLPNYRFSYKLKR